MRRKRKTKMGEDDRSNMKEKEGRKVVEERNKTTKKRERERERDMGGSGGRWYQALHLHTGAPHLPRDGWRREKG